MIVIKFSASWCGPCRMLKPIFEKVSSDEKYSSAFQFIDIDIDEDEKNEKLDATPGELSIRYMVRNIPTIIVLDDKMNALDRTTGLISEDKLREFLDNIIK